MQAPTAAPGMQRHIFQKRPERRMYDTHLQYADLTGSEPTGSGWTLCSYTAGKNNLWKSCSQLCTPWALGSEHCAFREEESAGSTTDTALLQCVTL